MNRFRARVFVVCVVLSASGCHVNSDGTKTPSDAAVFRHDADLHDAGDVVDASPADAGPPTDAGPPAPCTLTQLLVTTSDFTNGGRGVVPIPLGTARTDPMPAADQDTAAGLVGCQPVLLEHGAGHVRIQSPADPLMTVRTIDVTPAGMATIPYSANPSAIVSLSPTKAYVSLLAVSSLSIIDPSMAGAAAPVGTVDLSALAATGDTDSVDATDTIGTGGRVFVALGRYTFDMMGHQSFPQGSVLAIVDPSTDTLVDANPGTPGMDGIVLTGDNPHAGLAVDGTRERLLVGSSGVFGMMDGGIEAVSLTTLRTTGFVLRETDLGGELAQFVLGDASHGFALSNGAVHEFDPATGTLGALLVDANAGSLAVANGTLFVARTMGTLTGIRSFNVADGTETTPGTGAVAVGALPVYTMVGSP